MTGKDKKLIAQYIVRTSRLSKKEAVRLVRNLSDFELAKWLDKVHLENFKLEY